MKKIKVGVPRTSLYYEDGVFWKNYLLLLGCKTIVSEDTNLSKIVVGTNSLNQDNCLANKIFYGHILELAPKCDYIIINNSCRYSQDCPNYKLLKSNLNNQLLSTQLIYYKNDKYSLISKIKIARKFTKNPIKIIYSYIKASVKQKNYNINKQNYSKNKINKKENMVLIAGNNGIIEDQFIGSSINKMIEKHSFTPLWPSGLSTKAALLFSQYFNDKNITKISKRLIGSIYYYKYIVKGIIYIKNNNCILDSYIYNEILETITNIPIKNIEIIETTNDTTTINSLEIILNLIKK